LFYTAKSWKRWYLFETVLKVCNNAIIAKDDNAAKKVFSLHPKQQEKKLRMMVKKNPTTPHNSRETTVNIISFFMI
jgi:ribosomal 50S subunit-associated protein YjgA (DUF615 family)